MWCCSLQQDVIARMIAVRRQHCKLASRQWELVPIHLCTGYKTESMIALHLTTLSYPRGKLAMLTSNSYHSSDHVLLKTAASHVHSPRDASSSTLIPTMVNVSLFLHHLLIVLKGWVQVVTTTSIRTTIVPVEKTATLLYQFQKLLRIWSYPKESI
jgi:hypothetical protein